MITLQARKSSATVASQTNTSSLFFVDEFTLIVEKHTIINKTNINDNIFLLYFTF